MSKSDKPATKERLLDAAHQLMLAKGFSATTVEQICTAAEVTKGCFFHYFKGKEDLARATLERVFEYKNRLLAEAPFRSFEDPLDRVYGYVDLVIEMSQSELAQQGCLLGNFAMELSDTHENMRLTCAAFFSQWTESFQADLDQAKAQHAPDADFDTYSLAEHFIAVLEGAFILAKSKRDMKVVKESLLHFKSYLRSLFGK